jgi:hypothetical protein
MPLISLPYLLGVPDPLGRDVPYLHPEPDDVVPWQSRLAGWKRPLVGLVWATDPNHPGAENRTMPLAALEPLASTGATLLSLQVGFGSEQLAGAPPELPLLDLGCELSDFAGTAALLTQLDLVITVDTATAHLAGALGRPVWIMLCSLPDARWLLDREDSPWYPTARLFRQKELGDWAPVVEEVTRQLSALVGSRAS